MRRPSLHCSLSLAVGAALIVATRGMQESAIEDPDFLDAPPRQYAAFVGVHSRLVTPRRDILRQTWFPGNRDALAALEEAGVYARFVIGHPPAGSDDAAAVEASLAAEEVAHGDIFRIATLDSYENLSQKTNTYLRAALAAVDAQYYIKADDDVFVRFDRIPAAVAQWAADGGGYIGCPMMGGKMEVSRTYIYYEPVGALLAGRKYFAYMQGGFYAVSRQAAKWVTFRPDSMMRLLSTEDNTLGLQMLSLPVRTVEDRRLCSYRCTNTSIVMNDLWNPVHRWPGLCMPEEDIPRLHADPACTSGGGTEADIGPLWAQGNQGKLSKASTDAIDCTVLRDNIVDRSACLSQEDAARAKKPPSYTRKPRTGHPWCVSGRCRCGDTRRAATCPGTSHLTLAGAVVAKRPSHADAAGRNLAWSRFRAVTVVHEPCSTLPFTLTNFAGNLGPDWPLLVIYTPAAEATVLGDKAVRYLARCGNLDAVPLAALAIAGLGELADVTHYSRLLAHPKFWEAMRAEKVLVFQVDSALCSGSPFMVDDFLAYDYIGAPWAHADHAVGNGGLSLRSVDKMLHIAQHFYRSAHPEDVFFVEGLADLAQRDESVVRAPTSVAEQSSWEMDARLPAWVPFGVHRSNIVPAEIKAVIMQGCP